MKISYAWLQDFVAVKMAPAQLAEALTMAGLEVKSIDPCGDDSIFEIEITSNRPDWLSVAGVAREVAALTGASWKLPKLPPVRPALPAGAKPLRIEVEAHGDCPLYTGRIIRDVRVGPSPQWLKSRLEAVGCRSVNNVVDITNYILFAYGQPLHAFDLDALAGGSVGVRRARSGEQLTIIDGTKKQLSSDILVITDASKPVAIAGVMGGKDTEVTSGTKNIFLESAVFNPVVVRRGRQKLALQTEASYRFERGVDRAAADAASQRAAAMIIELCGGVLISCGSAAGKAASAKGPQIPARRAIPVDLQRVCAMLNVALSASRVKKILQPLGFTVKEKPRSSILLVGAPSFRQDVTADVDVLEEIARIYGYARIPVSLPRVVLQHGAEDTHLQIMRVKTILAGLGLYEVITYSLVDRGLLGAFGLSLDSLVSMQDPLNQDQEVMRTSLVPSLCRVASHNLKQQPSVRIFEIANVYTHAQGSGQPRETYRLAVCLCGSRDIWYGRKYSHVSDEAGWLHLKGIVEELLHCLGVSAYSYRAAGAGAFTIEIDGKPAGTLAQVRQPALEYVDIKNKDVFALELDLEPVLAAARGRKTFREFSRLPGVVRDISIVLERSVGVDEVLSEARKSGKPLLVEAAVTDYYTGQPIPAGKKNLTISCTYASSQRTLHEEEVLAAHAGVIARLKDVFQAEFR